MRYNEQKLRCLQEESRSMNAALVKLGNRRREAKIRIDQLQVEISNASRSLARELEIDLRHARTEHEQLLQDEEKAAQSWREVGSLVRKCEEFLAEKGIRLDGPIRTTVGQ